MKVYAAYGLVHAKPFPHSKHRSNSPASARRLSIISAFPMNAKKDLPKQILLMVEVTGFEPAASSSRTKRSTKLSHTSKFCHTITLV